MIAVQENKLTITYPRIIIEGMEYVSVDEAAQLTGYNTEYIRRLIRQGTIKAAKKSRVWWVELESLQAYKKQMDLLGSEKYNPRREEG